MPLPHGQIIRLKAGSEERYEILHRNTFPGVLSRIARSNISNYSIFLHDGLLFGFYEYCGNDFHADMAAMSNDNSTQEWWKLTAPLQEPLPGSDPDTWWTDLDLVFQHTNSHLLNKVIHRKAFFIKTKNTSPGADPINKQFLEISFKDFTSVIIFRRKEGFFCYTEKEDIISADAENALLQGFSAHEPEVAEMREVFYTAGAHGAKNKKRVFVTGCFDMLHSGHVEFLREASSYGDLFVCIGSDANVAHLKGRPPVNSQEERKYMLEAVRYVHECCINKGWGIMDFIEELNEIRPDYFIVNEDGNTPDKKAICSKLGIEYKVLQRIPHEGLPARSTTSLRTECHIPYRIDLAGGWLDQPFVSKYYPGPVITISIEPTLEFNDRSGMATSTRRKAIEIWQTAIPQGDAEKLAKILFTYDNPPGTKNISGSQDALGIVLPGLNKLYYNGGYWPEKITSVHQDDILSWLEDHLYLVTLGPRHPEYHVVENKMPGREGAKQLSRSAEKCWDAILEKDIRAFGSAFRDAFEAQVSMFPNMADDSIRDIIKLYKDQAYGWKLSGAGGGGYLILVTDRPVAGAIRIKIRRKEII